MSRALLSALRQIDPRRHKFAIEQVWDAFAAAHPADAEGADARHALRSRLDELARAGAIALPASQARWDRSAQPPLPAFVRVSRPRASAAPAAPDVAWAPELHFAREVTSRSQLAVLYAVQRFLRDGGRERPVVPERERSLQLFGDEKRLERIRRTALFGPGRLSLALLRCFSASPPLVWQPFDSDSRTGLILENHHSYWSFCSHARRTGHYAAVVYGAGKALCRSVESLASVARSAQVDRFEYFGDLDAAGLQIARLSSERAREQGVGELLPSAHYADLLGFEPRPGPPQPPAEPDLAWLPASLHAQVSRALSAGLRWPQEYVGTEFLRDREVATRGCAPGAGPGRRLL